MTDPLINIIVVVIVLAAVLTLVFLFSRLLKKISGFDQELKNFEKNQQRTESIIKEEIAKNRTETSQNNQLSRQEMSNSLKSFGDSLLSRMAEIAGLQKNQLDTFSKQLSTQTRTNEEKLEQMRETVEKKLKTLQDDNTKKLDQMRETVDEKLHATLEKRLGESFKLVSDRLEQVYKGLGEMQTLAAGVGDLKKVLSNVKSRGTWGEISLGFLIEELFTPEQYSKNVATKKGSSDRVEFAIRLPGRDKGEGEVWLPIDSKFPEADYSRLIEAQEKAEPILVEEAAKSLEKFIKAEAKKINEKYLDPPNTTDFGIMFLPVESLYSEVLRRRGLFELLQREFRITVTGPTTLAALLNSLQMGFRTLAIEKRSSEVWTVLGTVKTEFGKFGDILDKTQKKLQEASNTIETAARKSRTIERKLKDVQEMPTGKTVEILPEIEENKDD
jgi:DNA recombination protein RmuC